METSVAHASAAPEPRREHGAPPDHADAHLDWGDGELRDRQRIIESLENTYRSAFADAERAGDRERMDELDFDFQRDQVFLEVLLDARDLLRAADTADSEASPSLIERAKALKDLTKLR